MSANYWSVIANTAIGTTLVVVTVVGLIALAGGMANDTSYRSERWRWERWAIGFVIAALVIGPTIGFVSYKALVWDCQNGTRNSQCRPEDLVTRNDVNVDLNLSDGEGES